MNPAHKPLLWGAAVIAVGLLVILAVRGTGKDEQVPVATAPASLPGETAGIAAPSSSTAPGGETPPWMQPGSATASATASAAQARLPAAATAVASPAEIQQSLVRIRRQSEHNVRTADELLAQLDALEKSGKAPPDVRLDALRDNLLIAKQAQALARELAESTQLPDSPQRRQRHDEIVAELQQLQGRLRYDVAASPATGRQGR